MEPGTGPGGSDRLPAPGPRRLSPCREVEMAEQAIVIDPRDSVAVAVVELAAGQSCSVRRGDEVIELRTRDRIPFGHKVALRRIARGESVLKYGEVIGEATADIEPGDWVHVHNLASQRGRSRPDEEVGR